MSLNDDAALLARLGAAGLCATCVHRALKASASSVFLRCQLADVDPRFPRYPSLPVVACPGWRDAAFGA